MGRGRPLDEDAQVAGLSSGRSLSMRIFRKILPCLAIALVSGNAAAAAKLFVTATVVPTCRISVGVPKVGSDARSHGGPGSFEATCTRAGAISSAADGASQGFVASSVPRPQVRMTKGLVPHPKLDSWAHVADYEELSVAEVLF